MNTEISHLSFAIIFYNVNYYLLCYHTGPSEPSKQEQTLCAAVAATTKVSSKGKAKLEFTLCWDNPVVHFGCPNHKHYR